MSLHIKPVAGMSPASVAKELRTIIRDQLYRPIRGAKGASPKTSKTAQMYSSYFDTNHNNTLNRLGEITTELDALYDICKYRRPSEVRKAINEIRPKLVEIHSQARANRQYKDTILGAVVLPAPLPDIAGLLPAVERAYALVQALPTVEHASTGREESTLRAMTAILKVYYGIDVDSEPEDLVSALMKQLEKTEEEVREPQVWTPFVMHGVSNGAEISYDVGVDWAEIYPYADVRPFIPMPWKIMNGNGPVASFVFSPSNQDVGYGWGDPGSIDNWQGGYCSFGDALKALAFVRSGFSDPVFRLSDAEGLWWVNVEPKLEPQVLYIPSQEADAIKPVNPNEQFITSTVIPSTTVTTNNPF